MSIMMLITKNNYCNYCISCSVRAMQYVLEMTVNAKIPDDLVHKLSFERFKIKVQCLEWLPFNFKITVFLLWFWCYSIRHFLVL